LNGLAPGTYKIVIVNKSNSTVDSVDNIVLNPSVNSLKIDKVIDSPRCDTSLNKAKITLLLTNAKQPITYKWTKMVNNVAMTLTENDSIAEFLNIGKYQVTVIDANNCQQEDTSIIVKEKAGGLFAIDTIITPTSCDSPNGSILVHVMGRNWYPNKGYIYDSIYNPTKTKDFFWDYAKDSFNETLDTLSAGLYTITFYDTMQCYPLIIRNLQVKQNPAPDITVISGADSICINKGTTYVKCIVLKGDSTQVSYIWNTLNTDARVDDVPAGDYAVTVTDKAGCIDTAKITIANYPERQLELTADNDLIAPGKDATLTLEGPYADLSNIKWDTIQNLVVSNYRARVTPKITTTYIVTANYGPGCLAQGRKTITVKDSSQIINNISVPEYFSPNGNGVNDYFGLIGSSDILTSFEFAIYDRWGNKVYETFDDKFKWLGTDASGKPLQNGVYPYIMKFNTTELKYKFEKAVKTGAILLEK
jgi:gliding motility-associated-like protein